VDHVTSRAPGQDDRHAWARSGAEDLGGGLYRIPLPLPGDALTAVNVYAITGDHGVDLVDSGMAIDLAREQLTAALGGLGYGLQDIRNFFITHIHQDHYTLAVLLRTTLSGKITLGERERANMAALKAIGEGKTEPGFIQMLAGMGAADLAEVIRKLMAPLSSNPQLRLEWADPDTWLPDGTVIDLPSRSLRAINTPGHTSGHVVFHDEASALLFAGDHVLPHITPSIGFQPAITRRSLTQYLSSLGLLLTLPDATLLPAHGPAGGSTHARVNELLRHHETRLARIYEAASGGPVTARDVAAALPWTRRERRLTDLDPMNQLLAIGETAAHLEVLLARGQLIRTTSDEGVDFYTSPPAVG
jgi:glyoxylase-like metal-dependent hydrolase (beta-lactamase superfamily II)